MPFFNSDGLKIHYLDEGAGAAVVLVHGFASSAEYNWEITGWVRFLALRYRVLAPDCRGHGMSDKPHDRAAYGPGKMSGDIVRLLDHLGIPRAFLVGYSMGARICMEVLVSHPGRVRAAVLGGFGAGGAMTEPGRRKAIIDALLARDKSQIKHETARMFGQFAEARRNDMQALAACMDAEHAEFKAAVLATVKVPVLLVVGSRDTLVGGSAEPLRRMIPAARLLVLEGRDHLNAPGDRAFRRAAMDFFGAAPE